MQLKELQKQFLEYLEVEKGRSLKTVENYDRYLKRFLALSDAATPSDITAELVRNYRLKLNRIRDRAGRELKRQTQFYHLIALRSFLKYLAKRDIESLAPEKVELGKMPARSIEFMESEELSRLLAAPQGETFEKIRDRAMLELLFSTGLRVSELISLDCDSLDLKKDEFSVRGKGDKIRVVFLSDAAKQALKKYVGHRRDVDPALFVRLKGQDASSEGDLRLSARSVERLVKKYALQAGITKKVTPHGLRHAFATDLLSGGADLRSVQMLLGHAQITTTQIYTHFTDKTLRDIHRRFHGKSRR
ncbi:MAG: tyrosine-type recombinase/integrase [Candidatus Sungbacteria bacterium]|uniref:Tyrosine-type recombinase/integrase n=1 Tax=Candidatus Sungiibacteriota bacterium TaxID=2750080 RepID=A0A933DS31_9BACT|nr:tyrosine-type recombinase/integrase [Candidatus Sungbacteria bacterium]